MKFVVNIDVANTTRNEMEKRLAAAFPESTTITCDQSNVVAFRPIDDESVTVSQARKSFDLRATQNGGCICPVCDTTTRTKKHNLGKKDVRVLEIFSLYKSFVQASTLGLPGGDYAKLKHWGFLEPESKGKASKKWRITEKGKKFLNGDCEPVPRSVILFRGDLLFFDESGEMVTIRDIDE